MLLSGQYSAHKVGEVLCFISTSCSILEERMSAGDILLGQTQYWDRLKDVGLEPFISEDQMINFDDYFMGLILS